MIEVSKNIFSIFPVQVYIEKSFLSNDQCNLIFDFLKNENLDNHDLILGDGKSSYFEEQVTEKSILYKISKILPDIVDRVHDRVFYLARQSNLHPCHINFSWFNIQNENSHLTPHAHPGSVLSGALYIKTDENSSTLDFINPNYASFCSYSIDQNNYVLKQRVNNGTLIIFPSYLAHGNINTINRTHNRTVISFNTTTSEGQKYGYE